MAARESIRENLHMLHPSMQIVLDMCQTTLGNMILTDLSKYRCFFSLDFLMECFEFHYPSDPIENRDSQDFKNAGRQLIIVSL